MPPKKDNKNKAIKFLPYIRGIQPEAKSLSATYGGSWSISTPKPRPHYQQPPAHNQDNGGKENSPATNNHAALKIGYHAD
ncbi:hypothetical protein APS_1740 [Acetobacter pasteurianus subsp. pasteurianus LMG 1262 = NBRC 106471]|nr:hypothetical protein APS_1740 [Acetobacter pasteurianus subsp. pasteurianus LMG 1262 = NBRC 106471]